MKLKHLAITFFTLLAVLVAAPFFIPTGTYLPRLESMATQAIGVPVKIESLQLAVLPSPRAKLKGIEVGVDRDVRVEEVAAVLDLGTLFDPVRVVSRLEVRQLALKQSALALASALADQPAGSGTAPVDIRRIVLEEVRLELPDLALPAFDGEVDLLPGGSLGEARIASRDDKLKASIKPDGKALAIQLEARQWTPPAGPPLLLDSLTAHLRLEGAVLRIPAFNAKLYQGSAEGSGSLSWERQWKFGAKLRLSGVELSKPVRMVSPQVYVSGRMSGSGNFSAVAQTPSALKEKLAAKFRFDIARGVLHGMDLAKAASLFVKQGQGGGQTEFDKFSGVFEANGKSYRLHDLEVVSGLLAASGGVRISPAKKLDGQVDVELKKGLALVTVPLQVSGTVDAPMVMPTKAAMAGAAAGTAVLGPLGTSLGMKAGSAIDRMFGGGKQP